MASIPDTEKEGSSTQYRVVVTYAADRSTNDIVRYTLGKDHNAKPQDCINALDIVLRQVIPTGLVRSFIRFIVSSSYGLIKRMLRMECWLCQTINQSALKRYQQLGRSSYFNEDGATPIFNNLFLAYKGFFQVGRDPS